MRHHTLSLRITLSRHALRYPLKERERERGWCVTTHVIFLRVLAGIKQIPSFYSDDSVGELWLERPLETAMMLSLVGVAGVVSNQWHCQLSDNKQKLDTYLSGKQFVFCFVFLSVLYVRDLWFLRHFLSCK